MTRAARLRALVFRCPPADVLSYAQVEELRNWRRVYELMWEVNRR